MKAKTSKSMRFWQWETLLVTMGGYAHASDEWVSLKSVADYAAMFTEYLRAL